MADSGPTQAPATPLRDFLLEQQQQAKAAAKVATALNPLVKPGALDDLVKAEKAVVLFRSKIPAAARHLEFAEPLADRLEAELSQRRTELKEGLGRKLHEACTARGLRLRVLQREDPILVRIPPLAVQIDRDKGTAEIQFARQSLLTVGADADQILVGFAKALKALDGKFEAASFFQKCYAAWRAARAAAEQGAEDRVEILDFLPYLALQHQPRKFREQPTQKNFKDYGRAQFAWDVLRLRNARMLLHEGRRLNLGVATGTSASKKNRVVFFEDEHGEGEYKLTVFFTRVED